MIKLNLEKLVPSSKKQQPKETPVLENLDSEDIYDKANYEELNYEEDLVANNEPGGEMGDLLEEYELEDWELKDIAKKCLKYYRGESQAPFNDEKKLNEILTWYLDYLPTENEYGLSLSEDELNRLNEKERQSLTDLYQKRLDLELSIANLNNSIREVADIIRSEQTRGSYSTLVSQNINELTNLKEKAKDLYSEMKNNSKQINMLEEKAFTDPARVAKEEEENKKHEEENKKAELEKNYQKEKSKKPFFGEKEKELHNECLDYLTRDGRKKEIPVYVGQKLSPEQIKNTAREAAIDRVHNGEMMKASFFVEIFNGKRQLASVNKFFDNKTKKQKRVKYILLDDNLPAGYYAFKINPAKVFITKNNTNSAMAYVDLIVDIDSRRRKPKQKTA